MLKLKNLLRISLVATISINCFAAQNPNGSIEGTVTKAGSTVPLAYVNVAIRPVQATAGTASLANLQTDSAGHFRIDLPAGRYQLGVNRTGFGPLNHLIGNFALVTTVTVTSGGKLNLDLELVELGQISGRIADSSGRPVTGVGISVWQVAYEYGQKRLSAFVFQQEIPTRTTDDRGEYRIPGLDPGEYYIAAEYVGSQISNSANSYLVSYFPGTADMLNARPVLVTEGKGTSANFQMQTAPVFKVTGKIVYPNTVTPTVAGGLTLVRLPEEALLGSRAYENQVPVSGQGTGDFEIQNVPAGRYEVYVSARNGRLGATAPTYIGSTTLTVQGDVSGVSLSVHTEAIVKGRIIAGGSLVGLDLTSLRAQLHLDTKTSYSKDLSARAIADNGDVVFNNLPDGKYFVQINGMPHGVYLSDVRQSGRSVLSDGFSVTDGASSSELEIVLSSGAATVTGTVLSSSNMPAAAYLVVLVPAKDLRQSFHLYKQTIADYQGKYSFEGIPEGDYTLFAWERIPSLAYQNTEFLKQYESLGVPIHVNSNTTVTTPLNMISNP